MEQKVFDAGFELKALAEDGTFSGYASVFGVQDQYRDVVATGAFSATLAEWSRKGRMPALLWQHQTDQPIGVWTTMREDAKGLYVEGRLLKDEVEQAGEAYALLKAGAISGMSIGFCTVADEFDTKTGVRTLTQIDLWEVSLVTFPCLDVARVEAVKSADTIVTIRDFERALREILGFGHAAAKSIARNGFKPAARDADPDQVEALAALADRIRGTAR
jgi:HK97 family phage prohead protease